MPQTTPVLTAPLIADLAAAIGETQARVQRIDLAQGSYWVKQRERLGLRWRLQKGNPDRAFETERRALHLLCAADLPVPPIAAETPDFFATRDFGPTLEHMLRCNQGSEVERLRAFGAAGTGLAAFHRAGVSHGRPSLRDICWSGETAVFIDLERYRPTRNTLHWHAMDLLIFVLSAYATAEAERPEIDAACSAYRARGPSGVWSHAARICQHLRWLGWLTRPLQHTPGRHREFRAIPLLLRRFGPT